MAITSIYNISTPRIPLKSEKFKIGRLVGDFIIKSSELGDTNWYNTISQTQCEISRTEEGVFLTDLSSNGEFASYLISTVVTRLLSQVPGSMATR